MLRIGLTGGIGSGKSTVAECFARHGAPVIDTDLIARELVEPGRPALTEIAAAFGKDVLQADGALDRAKLRARVFADRAERHCLEAILHPRIRQEVKRKLSALTVPYCVTVVPLLIEAGFTDLVDRVLVVETDEATQVARTRARGLNEVEARRILAAQLPREERRRRADDVIVNSGTLAELEAKVAQLHARYLELARAEA